MFNGEMHTAAQWIVEFLINAAWLSAVTLGAAWLLARWARRSSALLEHRVWAAALVLSVMLPLVAMFSSGLRVEVVPAASAEAITSSAMPTSSFETSSTGISKIENSEVEDSRVDAMEVQKAVDAAIAPSATNTAAAVSAPTQKLSTAWFHTAWAWCAAKLPQYTQLTMKSFWLSLLAAAYLGWLIFGLTRLAMAWRGSRQMVIEAREERLESNLAAEWAECRQWFGLRRVRLLVSGEVAGPVTVGVVEPVLLVPANFLHQREQHELRAALCHELAHIRRKDFLLNLMYEALLVVMVFHPAVLWIKRRLDESREMVCDGMAAERLPSPGKYAQALLRLAELIHKTAQADAGELMDTCALGLFEAGNLERRVMNLLKKRALMNWKMQGAFVAVCGMLLATTAVVASAYHLRVVPVQAAIEGAASAANSIPAQAAAPAQAVVPADDNTVVAAPVPAVAPVVVPPAAAAAPAPTADAMPAVTITPEAQARIDAEAKTKAEIAIKSAGIIVAPDGTVLVKPTPEQMEKLNQQIRQLEKQAKLMGKDDAKRAEELARQARLIKVITPEQIEKMQTEALAQVKANTKMMADLQSQIAIKNMALGYDMNDSGPNVSGTFDKTLSVSGSPEVSLNTGSGYIHVHAGSGNEVHIIGHVHSGGDNKESKLQQVLANPPITQTGNTIAVGKISMEEQNSGLYRHIGIDYDVTLPKDTMLRANTGSGSIEVESIDRSVNLNTGSGDIHAQTIGGGSRFNTGSGSIRAIGIAGPADANTGSGDIELDVTSAGDVKANTGSGSIRVKGLNGGLNSNTGSGDITVAGHPTSNWRLTTASGSVRMNVGSGTAFTFDAATVSGTIRTEGFTIQGNVRRNRVDGSANGGGPKIDARTVSGDITIQ